MPVSISGDGAISGLELNDFEDVSGVPADGEALVWDNALGAWVPEVVTPTSLDASVITTGTLDVARIPNLDAAKITSGTLNTARIPNLDASKITTGVFNAARIPIKGIGSNVVQTVKKDTFSTTSATYINVTGLSATITPSSTSSKILVIGNVKFSVSNPSGGLVNRGAHIRMSGGGAETYVGNASGNRVPAMSGTGEIFIWVASGSATYDIGRGLVDATGVFLSSPATTSPVTYSIQIRGSGDSNAFVNRAAYDLNVTGYPRTASSITVIEVSG